LVRKGTIQLKKTQENRKLEKWSDIVSRLNLDLNKGVNLVQSKEIKEITHEEPRLMAKIDQAEDFALIRKKPKKYEENNY
jgi:GTP:adenosylcobinamide-phosphate guanylyltransferase